MIADNELQDEELIKTPGNEIIERSGSALVIRFSDKRNVLSTSWLNGGYRADLTAIFNHQISPEACETCHNGGNVTTYLEEVARTLVLDPGTVCGLITRADMKNAAIVSASYRDLSVCAIVTAGIDKNGARAGDPASYYENGDSFEPVGGTINTILIIGADLPEYAMARALMTATEAKAAALQQLMARSINSTGIATGSGTDMIAVVTNPGSPLHLSDAGKHAKLGELIGRTVIKATTAALEKETGLCAESQRDVLVRLSRFGVGEEELWAAATGIAEPHSAGPAEKDRFLHHMRSRATDPDLVSRVAAALHIVDEVEWGLVPRDAACRAVMSGLFPDDGDGIPVFRDAVDPLNALVTAFAGALYREFRGLVPPKPAHDTPGEHP
jgi:adenosylcobinamide hydrolase